MFRQYDGQISRILEHEDEQEHDSPNFGIWVKKWGEGQNDAPVPRLGRSLALPAWEHVHVAETCDAGRAGARSYRTRSATEQMT